MAINFRKRKKVLPGVYLNFSKTGISTTVGPRGANINFGKNGAYLNTGIPGTGLYSRKKIGGGNGNNPNFTPTNNFTSNPNTIKAHKTKTITILLALFLGTFGVHRFYLGQYWRGIFSVLFFWTWIPTFISWIDVIIFGVMSQNKFDEKYNGINIIPIQAKPNYSSTTIKHFTEASIPTSQSLEELKKHIEEARQERQELEAEIRQQQAITKRLEGSLKSKQSGIGKMFAKQEVVERLQTEVKEANEYLTDLYSQYEESQADINIESDKEFQEQYLKLKDAYIDLSKSNKIWDIVSERTNTEIKSSVARNIDRKEVRFSFDDIDFILSEHSAFHLENADGDNLYIYPAFILQLNNSGAITLIDLHDLRFSFRRQRFLEEKSTTPSDTQVVDYTWAKVNKDGSPDRRFSGNYQIPVVEYGAFEFSTQSGLREVYYISNLQLAERFANEFRKYLSFLTPPEVTQKSSVPTTSNHNFDINETDPLLEEAARLIVMSQQGSTSLIQRKLKLGYNRAGRIIDQLEAIGVIGLFEGSRPRDVMIPDEYALEQFLENLKSNKSTIMIDSNFSFTYYTLLKDFSVKALQIRDKLITNESIAVKLGVKQENDGDKIIFLIIYELNQVLYRLMGQSNVAATSLEATGFSLVANRLFLDVSRDFLSEGYQSVADLFDKGRFTDVVDSVLNIGTPIHYQSKRTLQK